MKAAIFTLVCYFLLSSSLFARDEVELDTTIIKGNKELPQILYLVPWKDIKKSKKKEQQIVLFSLFGDLFDPVNPDNSHLSSNNNVKGLMNSAKNK